MPQQKLIEAPPSPALLRFGQSLTLADFDGDERLDQAKLTVSGRRKSLDISLSQTKTYAHLHFDTRTSAPGSLCTEDIDNDGDADLIWTDLLHPNDVIIWLDDGTGRFERDSNTGCAEDFVLIDTPGISEPDERTQNCALITCHNFSYATPGTAQRISRFLADLPQKWQSVLLAARPLLATFDRSPPLSLL